MGVHPEPSRSEDDSVNLREQIKVTVVPEKALGFLFCLLIIHTHTHTPGTPALPATGARTASERTECVADGSISEAPVPQPETPARGGPAAATAPRNAGR